MDVAHPQSGSSSTQFLIELEFGNVGFWGEGKTGVAGKKPLGAKERTNNKLNPHMASTPGIWTRATLVGGERSHHRAIPCSPPKKYCFRGLVKVTVTVITMWHVTPVHFNTLIVLFYGNYWGNIPKTILILIFRKNNTTKWSVKKNISLGE